MGPMKDAATSIARPRTGRGPAVALCICVLSGCDVGPRYARPTVPSAPGFKEASLEAYRSLPPGTWQPAQPQDATLKGKWWQIFGEPELGALEEKLDIDNQTLAQYFQNFMAARAQVNGARAGYFPTVSVNPAYTNAGAGATAARAAVGSNAAGGAPTAAGNGPTVINTFSLPLEASWAPDLWDRVRNTVREYQYAAQVSAADLENERLTEQAALAMYYFELRGQDSLQDLYDRTVAADRQSLDLTRAQMETGVGTPEAVAQAEVTLENAEATRIGVATNRALYEHAMATLIGVPASTFSIPVRPLNAVIPTIPVAIPSQVLQRRPDVAAAERTLAQANAVIGVAKAAYYPSLNLAGSGGLQSSSLANLFSLPALFWSLGVSLSETIFDGGLRGATVAQYTALYKADVAAYRQTVLQAFQQVEDYVATLRVLSQQIARQDTAVKAAQRYLDIATAQFQLGLNPYLDVITAQTLLLTDQQTLVNLRVSEMTAAVQLVQALGGGWDGTRLPAASDITSDEAPGKVGSDGP
jgi:NodT family efflux transporter outer membrane factor (OMF) lipoprotein